MHHDRVVITGRRRRHGSLSLIVKDAHVDAARIRVTPAQIPGRHHQRSLVAQDLAQVMQFAAQVCQRLRIRGVRPQQAGDPVPGLRGSGTHRQESDQGDRARRPDLHASGPAIDDCLLPQERHMQHVDPLPGISSPAKCGDVMRARSSPMEIWPGDRQRVSWVSLPAERQSALRRPRSRRPSARPPGGPGGCGPSGRRPGRRSRWRAAGRRRPRWPRAG